MSRFEIGRISVSVHLLDGVEMMVCVGDFTGITFSVYAQLLRVYS